MLSSILIAVNVILHVAAELHPQLKNQGVSRALAVWDGEWWRLVTAMFLHGGIMHLLLNMYGLYILGQVVERSLGTGRFLVIYFAAGVYGFVVSLVFLPMNVPTLGASGSIFGLMGALIGREIRLGRHPLEFLEHDYGRTLVGYAIINLFLGFTFPGINNAAHIGGLAAGLLLTQSGHMPSAARPLGQAGQKLRLAAAVLCIQMGIYSFFPVFHGGWQLTQALHAQKRNQAAPAEAALRRALLLDRGLGRYKETVDLQAWLDGPEDPYEWTADD